MALVALVTWLATAGAGLYLLAVWLIEYDREYQATAATRLPVPVIGTHALLALAGIVVWTAYLLLDDDVLAWTAVAILACVAALGVTMAVRWFRSYRAVRPAPGAAAAAARSRAVLASTGSRVATAPATAGHQAVGPERNFPLPVVIGHGLLAAVTITLVLLTTLRA
jgi:manganese efflux pump family protein